MAHDTKLEDLSKERQADFYSTLRRLGYGEEWGRKALTVNSLEDWETYGFGSFNLEWFQRRVNGMVKGNIPTVDTVNAELKDLKNDYLKFVEFVNALEERLVRLEKKNGI